MPDISIGKGRLTWDRIERVTDRYGSVKLMRSGDSLSNEEPEWIALCVRPEHLGRPAQITAVVLETRRSTHIGDLFRGVNPSTPAVGEVIVLGSGLLFSTGDTVGVEPTDGRLDDWMDIQALYRCHEQTVELFYTEEL